MRIISKTRDAMSGAMLEAVGGDIIAVSERACSDGTTVIVEDLFANVPARRKFLKKDVTEAMAVNAVVEKIALSKPNIAFKLIIDGNIKLETIGDGNLKNTIYSIFGRDFSSRLIQTEIDVDGIVVKGFVGRSDNVRSNRNYQNFFINGRYVKSKTACAAIEQAYTSYIPPEKFPCCILFLTINPSAVDVNVHPAKLEVKFSNEKPVFDAVFYAVKNALEANTTRPNVVLSKEQGKNSFVPSNTGWGNAKISNSQIPIEEGKRESIKTRQVASEVYIPQHTVEIKTQIPPQVKEQNEKTEEEKEIEALTAEIEQALAKDDIEAIAAVYIKHCIACNKYESYGNNDLGEMDEDALELPEEYQSEVLNEKLEAAPVEEKVSEAPMPIVETKPLEEAPRVVHYKLIGEVFNSYVIVEREGCMLIIDKHAAHERIIFEQLKAAMKNAERTSQILMLPVEVMLTSDEIHTISEYTDELEAVGFGFTVGKYTVSVSEIPEGIEVDAVSDMLAVIAERLMSNTGSAKLTRDIVFEKALYQASCKAAIKAGREYPKEHIAWLVDKLMELPDITFCPHGRPVAMELDKKNLDRQFERT
jgi:DNA mismatch repair protein MutL